MTVLENLVAWLTGRVPIPEPIFNWMLRRRVERKGLRW